MTQQNGTERETTADPSSSSRAGCLRLTGAGWASGSNREPRPLKAVEWLVEGRTRAATMGNHENVLVVWTGLARSQEHRCEHGAARFAGNGPGNMSGGVKRKRS